MQVINILTFSYLIICNLRKQHLRKMMSENRKKAFAGKMQGHLGKILHFIVKYTHRPAFRWPELTSQDWRRAISLRHNGHDSVSNHQHTDCLLNRLFRRRTKKTSKLRVTGLCVGNSPGTGEFPAQMASNAENVSIWWRHHVSMICHSVPPNNHAQVFGTFYYLDGIFFICLSKTILRNFRIAIKFDCGENFCYFFTGV